MSIKNCKENQENQPTQNDTTIFRGFTAEEVINQKKSYWQDEKISQNYNANVKIDNNLFSKITFPLYKQFIKPTDRVLDMGTGTGRLSISLAEMGCEVVACDISKEMLNHIYIYITTQSRQLITCISGCRNV